MKLHDGTAQVFGIACVLILCVLLSACSVHSSLLVIDRSSGPIVVSYSTTLRSSELGFLHLAAPMQLRVELLKNRDRQWQTIPSGRLEIDRGLGSYVVTVPEGQAILLYETTNYSERFESGFPIERIEVRGVEGSLVLEGRQAQRAFSKMRGYFADWAIQYQ